jgi:cytochrome c oxidase subunit 2
MQTEFRWLPEQASTIAGDVDRLYGFLWIVSGLLTLLIGGLILYLAIKYRRGSAADRTQHATHFFLLEASWIVGPFIIVMIMFFWGAQLHFRQTTVPPDAMEVTAVGRQWMWKFQHPSGRSEINDLHVPLGGPIGLRMISEDVIHSLYIPACRVKQDVLPDRYTRLWFEPTQVGTYHLFCAEYCGAKHSQMIGYLHVMEPAEYQRWLSAPTGTGEVAATSLLDQLGCVTCHRGGGQASRAPALENLFGSKVVLAGGETVLADEDYLRESILRPQAKLVAGYTALMPSFAGQVTEETLNRLIAEIKNLGRADRSSGEAAPTEPKTTPSGPEQSPKQQAEP